MKKRIAMLLVLVFCVGATAVFADTDTENITVMSDGKVLEKDADYTLTYKNNVNPGTAMVTVKFIGNYAGELEKTFKIIRKNRTSAGSRRTGSVIIVESAEKYDSPYIFGYEDNTFRPEAKITRAEAATAIARAAKIEMMEGGQAAFGDVSGHWAKGYINAAAVLNIVNGYEDGSFRPDENITRAEFAKIIAKMSGGEIAIQNGNAGFTDVEGHWTEPYIVQLADKEIIQGYSDGTFRPDAPITRAEAVTIINRAVTRNIAPNLTVQFKDVAAEHWAYAEIVKAAGTEKGNQYEK